MTVSENIVINKQRMAVSSQFVGVGISLLDRSPITMLVSMPRIEQQLIDIGFQIDNLKADLVRSREQFDSLDDMAQDANLRAIVSETPDQAKSAHELLVAKERLETVIKSMEQEIGLLRQKRDLLLEKLFEESDS